jgi:6-phosphogluconolactonase
MASPKRSERSSAKWVGLVLTSMFLANPGFSCDARSEDAIEAEPESGVLRVYVGTYTGSAGKETSQGIYLLDLDLSSGKLGPPRLAGKAVDPSFLAIHPNQRFLYAVSERSGGAVVGFSINSMTGMLASLNQQSSRGAGPCHLVVDRGGRNVLVANYGSGSVACLPIGDDGRLARASSFIQHQGSGAIPSRQKGPHAHSINLDAAGRFAITADLGLDRVFVYRFDDSAGTLTANDPPFTPVTPASGPRHFAFHPEGRFGYVINEMANTVTAFAFDSGAGSLEEIQTISTLPEGYRGPSSTAEVQVHPSGKFLYGSNRGHDSIATYAIDTQTGKLTIVGIEPTQGKNPRNFAVDPTGAYLLAENGDSGTIVVFRIDQQTGAPRPTGQTVHVPKPVCIKMIPKPASATQ